jgi:hypothetical protein
VRYSLFIFCIIVLASCTEQDESGMLDITMTDDELINSIDDEVTQELIDYDFLVKDATISDSSSTEQ